MGNQLEHPAAVWVDETFLLFPGTSMTSPNWRRKSMQGLFEERAIKMAVPSGFQIYGRNLKTLSPITGYTGDWMKGMELKRIGWH